MISIRMILDKDFSINNSEMFHIYVQKNGLNLKMDIEFASFVCLLIDTFKQK